MAKPRRPDYHEDVYHFICTHMRDMGNFPSTDIAGGLNLNYETVYTYLKVLESHGLIEQTRGKHEAGVLQVPRRLVDRVRRQPGAPVPDTQHPQRRPALTRK